MQARREWLGGLNWSLPLWARESTTNEVPMNYVFEPEAQVTVPIAGSDALFPVRRVYCVGRNYAAHAREMGFDPDREPPFFFC